MPSIFISYRREEAGGYAGHLAADLTARFGRQTVFIDIDAIAPGVDFEERIQQALDACQVTLVLIGKEWMTIRNPETEERRLQNPGDHVRREIAAALRREDVMVIPILLEDAGMPQEAELPPDIAALARRHAFRLNNEDWLYRTDRLCERIAEVDRFDDRGRHAGDSPSRLGRIRAARRRPESFDTSPRLGSSEAGSRFDRIPVGHFGADDAAGAPPDRRRGSPWSVGAVLPWVVAGAAVVVVLVVALKPHSGPSTRHGGATRRPATTSTSARKPPAARATNPIMQALASANDSRMARNLVPLSSCTARSSTQVTCTQPANGVTTVSFQTFPSLSDLYQRYLAEFRSLAEARFHQNFHDCNERQTYGEVSWNHAGQHSRKYALTTLASGRLDPNDAVGRVFCTFGSNGGFYIVWTQNPGRLLGIVTGGPHDTTWDWWHGVHHSIALGPGMSTAGGSSAPMGETTTSGKPTSGSQTTSASQSNMH